MQKIVDELSKVCNRRNFFVGASKVVVFGRWEYDVTGDEKLCVKSEWSEVLEIIEW